jgi:outer membrane protein assembly factor BamD (BamD/ComL family)
MSGGASVGQSPSTSMFSGLLPQKASVGSTDWWEKHQKKAKFEPGKGYVVEGVEGYFDQNGRPIDRPVERDDLTPAQIGLFPSLDPEVAYKRMKNAVGGGRDQQLAQGLFDEAEAYFAEGNFFKAAWHYKDAADRYPNSQLEEDALFMVGECRYFDDRYLRARDAYNKVVSKYPNTRHLNSIVDRQWAIAQYWEKKYFDSAKVPLSPNPYDGTRPTFDTIGHAVKTYENIRLNDPTGPRADDAILATAGIHFRRERYEEADYHYTLLRNEYPRSEFQFEAHLLGLQAKRLKYQGPDYDGAALEEAQRLAKQLRTQFAGQLSAEQKERLRTEMAELNRDVAAREVRMAKYYDDKDYFLAAREYYRRVVDQYPDSPLADEARTRLAAIADEPDVPPERLAWFVEMFPESRERTRVARIPELQGGRTIIATNPNPTGDSGVQPASATITK